MHFTSTKLSQQRFSDLNRYAKQPTKTQNILYSHRDIIAVIAKKVTHTSRYYDHRRVNLENNTLSKGSRQVITLGVLYECVKTLVGLVPDSFSSEEERDEFVTSQALDIRHVYDDVVFPALADRAPELNDVYAGREPAHTLRQNYIFAHSGGQQAIALAVSAARAQWLAEWERRVSRGFREVDWRIGQHWEGIAISGRALATRRQNIHRTAALLKAYIGVPLSEAEENDLLETKRALGEKTWRVPVVILVCALGERRVEVCPSVHLHALPGRKCGRAARGASPPMLPGDAPLMRVVRACAGVQVVLHDGRLAARSRLASALGG
jgi:hypothetical protein